MPRAPMVIWDPVPWARIVTPYDEDFAIAIKRALPIRAWDPVQKAWAFPSTFVEAAVRAAKPYFGKVVVPDNPFTGQPVIDPHPGVTVRKGVPEHYQILCVHPDAPNEVVKAAYKALAMLVHPDRGGDPEHMRTLNAAYEKAQKERGL